MSRRLALLGLVRWPGAVTAAGNAATCFLLAHQRGSPSGVTAAAGALIGSTLIYAGGVVLNDVADAERDRTLHPPRPLPSGTVSRVAAARFGLGLLLAGVAAVGVLANPDAALVAAAAAGFAVAYDFVGRGARITGAVLLGLARGTNAAAGAVAALGGLAAFTDGAAFPSLFHLHPVALFAYTALLTWISTFEERRPARWVAGALALSLAVTAAIPWAEFPRTSWRESPGIPLFLLLGVLVGAARDAQADPGPGIGAIVRAGVFGFLLVDAAWLFGNGRYDAGFWAILVYALLRLALARARS